MAFRFIWCEHLIRLMDLLFGLMVQLSSSLAQLPGLMVQHSSFWAQTSARWGSHLVSCRYVQ